jgi:hypothetical protein
MRGEVRVAAPRRATAWLAAAALALVGSSAAASCEGLPPPRGTVDLIVEPPDKPAVKEVATEAITRAARRSGATTRDPKAVTRGLTMSEIRGNARYEVREVTLPSRRKCIALSTVSVRFRVAETTILVDRRYRPGSCERAAVLKHERQHVRITAEGLRRWEGRIRQRLERATARWRDGWSEPAALARIEAAVNETVGDLIEEIQADMDRQHAAIDTPAYYEAVQQQCDRW